MMSLTNSVITPTTPTSPQAATTATTTGVTGARPGTSDLPPEVIARAQTGDHAAFEAIFAHYYARIWNYLYRLVGDAEDASELTQDVFLRVHVYLPRTLENLKLGAWLYRMATNRAMDLFRHRRLVRWNPLTVLSGGLGDTWTPRDASRPQHFRDAWQTARKAIDDGLIGRPFAAVATLHPYRSPRTEATTPRPTSATHTPAPGHVPFFQTDAFKYGVTVVFDIGPYYFHALINLLGPARRVVGATAKPFDEAMRMGSKMKVESPTHVAGILEFGNGAHCQLVATSDVHPTKLPNIEIYGTDGSLRLPDPNYFPGPVLLRHPDSEEWIELECKHPYNQDSRGLGVADMAVGIRNGRPHRAAGEMGAHIVEMINAIHQSSDEGRRIDLTTTCPQPEPLPVGLENWRVPD